MIKPPLVPSVRYCLPSMMFRQYNLFLLQFSDVQKDSLDSKKQSQLKIEKLEKNIEEKISNIKEEFQSKLREYEKSICEKEKSGEESVKAIEEILKQTEEDADKVFIRDGYPASGRNLYFCHYPFIL